MFYENKLALCVNAIKNLANLELKQILYNINNGVSAGVPSRTESRPAFIRGLKDVVLWRRDKFWQSFKNRESLIQWIKTLDYNSEDTINAICAILRIDTAEYLRSQRPYLASEEIKTLAADGFAIGHESTHLMPESRRGNRKPLT